MPGSPDQPPNTLSASEAARRIAAGTLSSEALVRACLARVAAREPQVSAWAFLSEDGALAEARQRDREPSRGPLHGIPVAVKDVLDTSDMPTAMGSPIYDGHRPRADAACVAIARAAGAVILGKTVTAEFAGIAPGPTRNPLDPERTPGGSSSGSAAAVADFMVPLAFGTQTGGSILRPAAYCGIVGFKPSFGTVNRAGLKLAAESLDTIGTMARTLDDAALLWRVLTGRAPPPCAPPARPPRFALFPHHPLRTAAPDMAAALCEVAARLRDAGAEVTELPQPDGFDTLCEARAVINNVERARALAWEWEHHRDALSPALAGVLADGWRRTADSYLAARRIVAVWRGWLDGVFAHCDALLAPSVAGTAPKGLASTGEAAFQEIWSLLHAPSISLPLAAGSDGLPLGIQLVGPRLEDEKLLAVAAFTQRYGTLRTETSGETDA